jgi:hypothetical protein
MKILVMKVPDEWGIEDIQVYHPNFDAPNFGNGNAKEAVEVYPPENNYNLKEVKPDKANPCRWEYYGSPMRLYAVKEDK